MFVPLAVVEKLAVAPSQTVTSAGSDAEVFCCTVKLAVCVALLQAPVTVTDTECEPTLKPVVSTLSVLLFPPDGEPSTVQAYVNGPVPEAVVEKLAIAPWQTV
jgi:hypothetical protein